MSTKALTMSSSNVNAAGIYADMTVDGPEIGDLVVIVDKAKNLPNRKTLGKQNPYCAARLGKEAKKTETDKRGGQTPRWDEELRFTVHDSADYYQLKVSVFNDDKKTDLIGDALVNLENVVVRGGGRHDGWHSLNFRGKFAGEIRIELTYYDIRPKAEKLSDGFSDAGRNELGGSERRSRDAPAGARQPKPVKRRPLPSDPVANASSQSLPVEAQLHYDAPTPEPQGIAAYRPYSGQDAMPPYPPSAAESYRYSESPSPLDLPALPPKNPARNRSIEPRQSDSVDYTDYGNSYSEPRWESGYEENSGVPYGPDDIAPPPPPVHSSRQSSMEPMPPSHAPRPMPHSHSAPAAGIPQVPRGSMSQDRLQEVYGTTRARQQDHDGMRHHSYDDQYHGQYDSIADEAPPPAPPAHRNSVPLPQDSYGYPAPLKIAQKTPPPQVSRVQAGCGAGAAHSTSDLPSQMPSQIYGDERRYSETNFAAPSQSAIGDGYNSMPASLMAGRSVDAIPPRMPQSSPQGKRISARVSFTPSNSPHGTAGRTPNRLSQADVAAPAITPQHIPRDQHQMKQPAHRSSAPIVRPRAVSPDVRTPARKSVSPGPQVNSIAEGELTGVPFSPDSYDALNPKATSPATSDGRSSQYQTSERASNTQNRYRGESFSRETPNEPIIGNDGRVIDPSDHLPTDTWAPEPEKKGGRDRVDTRTSRSSPHGPASMTPPVRRLPREHTSPSYPANTPSRPNSMATPIYAHSHSQPQLPTSAPQTPSSAPGGAAAARHRLQKRGLRPQSSSPGLASNATPARSSPLAPESHHYQQQHMSPAPRHEYDNAVYHSSPVGGSYNSHSPGAGYSSPMTPPAGSGRYQAPSVPPKIPLQLGTGRARAGESPSGGEDYSALSQELQSIQIGSMGRRGGGGAPRGIPAGYGHGHGQAYAHQNHGVRRSIYSS